MLTAYQTATAAARRAARLFLTHAVVMPGFSSPADLPGLGLYTCPATGLEIVLTRSGAVDAKATKARRIAKEEAAAIAADMAGRALARRMAKQEEAAAIDSEWPAADLPADFCADLDSDSDFDGMATTRDWTRKAPADLCPPAPAPKAALRLAADKKAARRAALIQALQDAREARAARCPVTLAPMPRAFNARGL